MSGPGKHFWRWRAWTSFRKPLSQHGHAAYLRWSTEYSLALLDERRVVFFVPRLVPETAPPRLLPEATAMIHGLDQSWPAALELRQRARTDLLRRSNGLISRLTGKTARVRRKQQSQPRHRHRGMSFSSR